jgi:protein transport protein SEC23
MPAQKIQSLLGFSRAAGNAQPSSRFLVELGQCEEILENILEELQPDPFPIKGDIKGDTRPKRCTGVALQIAVSLLEVCI